MPKRTRVGVGLFPASPPVRQYEVAVGSGHTLSVREWGNGPTPVVYLHGGPGGGTPPDICKLFDPEQFRLVAFDQRGCGRSRFEERLRANTCDALVSDVEAVREAAGGIETWGVMGSSYGVLLASLYAARHPARARWVLLHGCFTGSRAELEWLYEGGAARFYPAQWAAFEAALGTPPQLPPDAALPHVAGYARLICRPEAATAAADAGAEAAAAVAAASAFVRWEDELETLEPHADDDAGMSTADLLGQCEVQLHHFGNDCFLPSDEGALPELRVASGALSGVRCAIIHGRHDMVCPPRAAAQLHALWPGATLRIVESGAHALFEKPMRSAAQACLAEFAAGVGAAGQTVRR